GFGHQRLDTLQGQRAGGRIAVLVAQEQLRFEAVVPRVDPALPARRLQRVELGGEGREIEPRAAWGRHRVEPGEDVMIQLEPIASTVPVRGEDAVEQTGIAESALS